MQILELLLFLVPIYVANSSPVVLGGGKSLDFGKNFFDGERIFGDGKTIRGFIGGTLAGTFVGGLLAIYMPLPFFPSPVSQFFGSAALAFGTLCGDALGSFIKRRMKIGSGRPFVLDTMMFLLVALAFSSPFASSSLYAIPNLLFFMILTLILHPLTNFLANRAGLKSVPW